MASNGNDVAQGQDAVQRWANMNVRRRWAMFFAGREPRGSDEALIAVAFARQMASATMVYTSLAVASAFVMPLIVIFAAEGELTDSSYVTAAIIAMIVGITVGLGGSQLARRMERRASRAVDGEEETPEV